MLVYLFIWLPYIAMVVIPLVPILALTYGLSYFLKVMMGTSSVSSTPQSDSPGRTNPRPVDERIVRASAAGAAGLFFSSFVLFQSATHEDLGLPGTWFAVWCSVFCLPLVCRYWGAQKDSATLLGRGLMVCLTALAIYGWLDLHQLLQRP